MAPVTGTLQSGTYAVTNVSSGNYATLKDANNGSNVIGTKSADSDDVKWTVDKLSNNNYTFMSYTWATYANVGGAPKAGDTVDGKANAFQWVVRETNTKGVYLIYPTSDDSLFWGLENSNVNTRVKLSGTADDKAKWQFNRVQA